MASRYGKRFDKVLRQLRRECPISLPIKVVTKDLTEEKLCGCCVAYIDNKGKIEKFIIEIDRNMPVHTAIDTLLHEWAHAMDKEANGIPLEPHRNSWGECYARTWRVYMGKEPLTED
jgi:hypothetical protein